MADGKFLIGKPAGGVTTVTMTDGASNTNLVLPESGTVSGVTTAVTDNAIARFDGTTGKLQNSGVEIDDNGNITASNIPSTNGGSEAFSLKYAAGQKVNVISSTRSHSEWSFGFGVKPSGTTVGEFISTIDNTNWQRGALLVSNTLTFLKAPAQNTAVGSTVSMTEVFKTTTAGDLLLQSGTGALGYGPGTGGIVTQLTSKSTAVTLNKPTGQIIMNSAPLAAGMSVYFQLNNSLLAATDQLLYTGYYQNANPQQYRFETAFNSYGAANIRVTNITGISLSEAIQFNFSIVKGVNA